MITILLLCNRYCYFERIDLSENKEQQYLNTLKIQKKKQQCLCGSFMLPHCYIGKWFKCTILTLGGNPEMPWQ